MPKLARCTLLLPALAALAAFAACNGGDEQPPTEENGHEAIDALVEGLPDLPLPDAQPKTEIMCDDASCPADGLEGDSYCTYRRYTETAHFDKFVTFQPNSATLWPGVVVRGDDAQEGLLTPVGVKLAPVTFSVSLENLANSPVGHMDDPSLSAFREKRNEILAGGVTGATAASLDFDITQIHSESQIATSLGAGVNWPGGPEIAASFDFSSQEKKTKILVNFTQSYYTIDIDSPTTPKDFFDTSVTADDLLPYVDATSPPVYVQSITFGRRVLFSVESDASAEALKAALEATYKGVVDVSAEVSVEHKQVLDSSTIQAFVIGGAGGEAAGVIAGFDALVQFIKNGGDYSKDSPGAPIGYKLAYLDNAVTKLAFTTEYSERDCVKSLGTLHAELLSLTHVSGGDSGSNMEFYGSVTLRHPTAADGVLSCSEGGAVVDVWRLDDGSWLSMPEKTTWQPEAPAYVDVNEVPMGPGKMICLSAVIREEDSSTGELSGDDDFGVVEQLVAFENGWEGEHTLHLHGSGENAIDVTLRVTAE